MILCIIVKKSINAAIRDKLALISFLNIRETVVYGRKIWIMPRTTWTREMGKNLLKHSSPIISVRILYQNNHLFKEIFKNGLQYPKEYPFGYLAWVFGQLILDINDGCSHKSNDWSWIKKWSSYIDFVLQCVTMELACRLMVIISYSYC